MINLPKCVGSLSVTAVHNLAFHLSKNAKELALGKIATPRCCDVRSLKICSKFICFVSIVRPQGKQLHTCTRTPCSAKPENVGLVEITTVPHHVIPQQNIKKMQFHYSHCIENGQIIIYCFVPRVSFPKKRKAPSGFVLYFLSCL